MPKNCKGLNFTSLLYFWSLLLHLISFISNKMIYTCRKSKQDENGKKKSKTFYFYEFFSLWVLPYAVVILYKICLFGYGYNFSTKDLKHLCSSVKLCVKTEKTKNKNKNNEALGMIWLWWFLGTICWMTTNLFLSLC